jgi:hypothetical protein
MQLVKTLILIVANPDFYIAYFDRPGNMIHEPYDSNALSGMPPDLPPVDPPL